MNRCWMDRFGGFLRLASRFPSRPASACFDTRQDPSCRIIVINSRCICIDDLFSRGTLELLLQGSGMAIAEPKKNNRHLPGEENAAFIARFLCQICRFPNSTMLCPLVIQRLTFDSFSFSDLSIFSGCSRSPGFLILHPGSSALFA